MTDDVRDSVIQKTQKLLGKHINKPTLTPKLLKKPPFRFLHDVVTSVIRETGFLKGLFSEQEMVSENVKEKDAKVAFLAKLIGAIVAISGNELDIKPGKIVAGLEATKTNKLLQTLGSCLDKKLDSTEYVNKLNGGDKQEKKIKKSSNTEKTSKTSKDVKGTESNKKPERTSKTTKNASDSRAKPSNEKLSKASTDSTRKETKTKTSTTTVKEKSKKVVKNKEPTGSVTKIETPTKLKEINKEREDDGVKEDVQEQITKAELFEEPKEVSLENQAIVNMETKEDEHLGVEEQVTVARETSARVRPKSAKIQPETAPSNKIEEQRELKNTGPANFLRPPSVRPMSARPGAPRLRPESALPTDQVIPLGNINVIVENCSNQDDEETVVIQNVELPQEQPSVEDILNIPQDKGHLVEQILEQINDVDEFTQMKNARNEEGLTMDTHTRDVTQKEIHQLQNLVQTLTKVANPLGKLMNYLHEDLDSMHSELIMWINMKKQAYNEIRKQKEQQKSSNATLRQQLQDVEENIRKVEAEISYVQSNILKNDVRIKQLLTK